MDYAGEPPPEEQMSTQKEHHHQKVGSQRVKPSRRGQGELEKKNALQLLSQDVFIANPSGGLHKSEVPQKHAP